PGASRGHEGRGTKTPPPGWADPGTWSEGPTQRTPAPGRQERQRLAAVPVSDLRAGEGCARRAGERLRGPGRARAPARDPRGSACRALGPCLLLHSAAASCPCRQEPPRRGGSPTPRRLPREELRCARALVHAPKE